MTGAADTHGWAGRGWRRGGRWDRILAALYRHDLTEPAIRHATQTGEHPRKLECKKVKRALAAMARAGLIQRQASIWTITARGSQTLRHGRMPPVDDGRAQATTGWPEAGAAA
tara:strand:+ start:20742 stop:21080 length:339 start_codon:yes stop_codon:yes gene_type:complete